MLTKSIKEYKSNKNKDYKQRKLKIEDVRRKFNDMMIKTCIQKKEQSVLIKQEILKDDNITTDDTLLIGDARIDEIGFVDHHISSFNDFVDNGVKQIITKVFKIDKDFTIFPPDQEDIMDRINMQVEFTDVKVTKPTYVAFTEGISQVLMPNPALIGNKTYSAALYIDAKITATAYLKNGSTKVRETEIKNKKICSMPIMVKSSICNTHRMSQEALLQQHEDPTDLGGYFIIKGVEWAIDSVENITYNQPRIFKNVGYQKEETRCEFISKPGDSYQNSDQVIIRLMSDGQITVDIRRDKLKDKMIPFYLIFRALGWTRDVDIINNIVYDMNSQSKVSKFMAIKLLQAFKASYNQFNGGLNIREQMHALEFIAEKLANEGDKPLKYLTPLSNAANMHQAINSILRWFDIHFFPHIGLGPNARNNKLRFLSQLIRKLFLVNKDIISSTDRDALKNKRIHPSGISYAKAFKTFYNASIIQNIIKKGRSDFKNLPFEEVNLSSGIESLSGGEDFDKLFMQTITSGNKSQLKITVKRTITNRLSSQQLHRKNKLKTLSTLRQITSTNTDSSKSSDRASEMRRVHPTYLGYICPVSSPEGEKVGITKQLAIFSHICGASNSEVIKQILIEHAVLLDLEYKKEDKDNLIQKSPDDVLFLLDDINYADIYKHSLNNVYVNGYHIGFTKSALAFAQRYRRLRRGPNIKLDPFVTIHWDEIYDETYFWTDPGRLARPLMIVYNNMRDPDKFSENKKGAINKSHTVDYTKFLQTTLLSPVIIRGLQEGTISMLDLLENGIIEYITAEEQENIYICSDIEQLQRDKKDATKQYTHCDIPQALLGLGALTSPFANHNQTPRVTFQTNQAKQTCGYYTLNWPFRVDKDTFLQYTCETPIVRTLSNKYLFPNGINCMVAIAINGG